ncbi:MAG: hypothetical protein J6B45_04450 [Clostridia bacterium]|nr:hypothetical protein [Clostridia bacterium]
MYCIKCGIELSDGQTICPICQTRVYHPDFKKSDALPTYPKKAFKSEEINIRGLLFILTLLHLIPIVFALILDLNLNGRIDWMGYVVGTVVLLYVCAVLPLWFKKPNPVVFIPCDFLTLAVFLWNINLKLHGEWFWTLALPITAGVCLITTAMIVLLRYLRHGRLFVFGGGFILSGALVLLIEQLMHITFDIKHTGFAWSLYPMVFLAIIGCGLIVIEIVKPFKESLKKIFFL